jgi:O-methyltransferase
MDSERPILERAAHAVYERVVFPFVDDPLKRHRLKMLWFIPGYWRLIAGRSQLSFAQRFKLFARFTRIDWNILHAHTPYEITCIVLTLARAQNHHGNAFVEAGCWNGGSSAKLSLLCEVLGLELHVYDSFQGVEPVPRIPGEWDFAGEYASPERTVRENMTRFGAENVVSYWPGWFAETLAKSSVKLPVSAAYIDCDLAKGTYEALLGIVPSLAPNGVIFSQDFHIGSVRALLLDPETWAQLGMPVPNVTRYDRRLVRLDWRDQKVGLSTRNSPL